MRKICKTKKPHHWLINTKLKRERCAITSHTKEYITLAWLNPLGIGNSSSLSILVSALKNYLSLGAITSHTKVYITLAWLNPLGIENSSSLSILVSTLKNYLGMGACSKQRNILEHLFLNHNIIFFKLNNLKFFYIIEEYGKEFTATTCTYYNC